MTRLARYAATLALGHLIACRPHGPPPMAREDESLQREEADLLARRGALQRERRRLVDERMELAEKRKAAPVDPSAAAALEEQDRTLAKQEVLLLNQESDLVHKIDALLNQRSQLIQRASSEIGPVSGEERVVRRESSVASREKDLARRESELAGREEGLAGRERDLARREKESCAPQPVKVELPKALKYGLRDVEPVYKRALRTMQERGLLAADLANGGKLVDDARLAMQAGDYVRAKYAADQLLEDVQGVRVDRAFIAAKMARLAVTMKGRSLQGDAKKAVDGLLEEATRAYGDGKFAQANQKINRLFSLNK